MSSFKQKINHIQQLKKVYCNLCNSYVTITDYNKHLVFCYNNYITKYSPKDTKKKNYFKKISDFNKFLQILDINILPEYLLSNSRLIFEKFIQTSDCYIYFDNQKVNNNQNNIVVKHIPLNKNYIFSKKNTKVEILSVMPASFMNYFNYIQYNNNLDKKILFISKYSENNISNYAKSILDCLSTNTNKIYLKTNTNISLTQDDKLIIKSLSLFDNRITLDDTFKNLLFSEYFQVYKELLEFNNNNIFYSKNPNFKYNLILKGLEFEKRKIFIQGYTGKSNISDDYLCKLDLIVNFVGSQNLINTDQISRSNILIQKDNNIPILYNSDIYDKNIENIKKIYSELNIPCDTETEQLKKIIKESTDINTRLRLLDALKISNNNNYIDEIKWNLQSLYCFLSFTELDYIYIHNHYPNKHNTFMELNQTLKNKLNRITSKIGISNISYECLVIIYFLIKFPKYNLYLSGIDFSVDKKYGKEELLFIYFLKYINKVKII